MRLLGELHIYPTHQKLELLKSAARYFIHRVKIKYTIQAVN